MIKLKKITATFLVVKKITAEFIGEKVGLICRFISNFNGVDSYAESDSRIIDLDAVDPSFKFAWWGRFDGNGTHFSQNISGSTSNREFQIFTNGSFDVVLGGESREVLTSTMTGSNSGYGMLEIEYNHSLAEIYVRKDDALLNTVTSVVIGAAREPTAKFKYMARSNNSVDSEAFFKDGELRDVIIDHNSIIVDLPMNEGVVGETGTVNYINRTGNALYNATGYNITVTEECSEIPPPESNNLTYNNGADNVTYDNGNDNVVY